jgi:hypothetical protein
MKIKYAAIIFFISFSSCDTTVNKKSPRPEITELSQEQITLYTVRGVGDYLYITNLAPDTVIKVKEYSPDGTRIFGGNTETDNGNCRYTFFENLGRYGKNISVTVTEPEKIESYPVLVGAEPEPPLRYDESVKKVHFTDAAATVNFDKLSENDIYLIKINKSDFVVNAANTGNSASPDGQYPMRNYGFTYDSERDLPPMGHVAAREFNANPPPIIENQMPSRLRAAFVPPVVGDTKFFWVESYHNSGAWVQKQATLRAAGTHGNIWVMDESYSPVDGGKDDKKITTAQAEALADKFDVIYPIETNLLGFEYGGGPGGNGGRDNDPKIQILVYDIVDSSGNTKAAGFFWSKDYYSQSQLGSGYKTNLSEIFYLNAGSIDNAPDYMYSALVHEFQHMINFNMKYVKHRKNSASWYDEMLSTMAEDVISPLIGVGPANRGHPIQTRINTFLTSYNQVGITEWHTLESASYAKGYAFGAYLMRNYGGAELLSKILANATTNAESLTAALNEMQNGLDFERAIERYGEAFIFSGSQIPEGSLTFDKTVVTNINGISYTAYGFDIWNRSRSQNEKGPLVFDVSQVEMRPYSVILHSTDAWKNRTGSFSITLEKPIDQNIAFYLMTR